MAELKPCPFKIDDIVYIFGKYLPDSEPIFIEAKISHIKHRQFIAYVTDRRPGEWAFSKKHYNKCVFKDEQKAKEAWNRRVKNG
jgi:hypothetical protein